MFRFKDLWIRLCQCITDKKEEKSVAKDEENRIAELPDEIWLIIMWKLPIKSLHKCKCVSKTWYSQACYIIATQKGIQLPPHGLLFKISGYPPGSSTRRFYLGYLPLGDRNIRRLFRDSKSVEMSDQQDKDRTRIKVEDDYGEGGMNLALGNLTLDFGSLISDIKKDCFWTMHRGLVLTVPDSETYRVYNPATGQGFVLPCPPSVVEKLPNCKRHSEWEAAIINLSDCLLSTQSNFRVIKIYRERYKDLGLVELYCSNRHRWFQSKFKSEFHLDKKAFHAHWSLAGAVFLDNTLYFMTNKKHVVRVEFVSSEEVTVHSLRLPKFIKKGCAESTLHGSQGCLYLCYDYSIRLRIWKHDGSSADSDAWIPQLVFRETGISLCQPVTESFLRQFVADNIIIGPMVFHPEEPVVFVYAQPSIYAIHLFDDTVEKVTELTENENFSAYYLFLYSPCFASLKCP